jgi:hypothetical protein
MRDLALRGVAIDAAGTTVAVGTSRAPSVSPDLNAPFILVKSATALGFTLWQAQSVTDTSLGGLEAVATDSQGGVVMVGKRALGSSTAGVAYRLPTGPTDPLIDLSASLPSGIRTLEDVATDGQGTWVTVGGDRGVTTRSTDLGTTWSPAVAALATSKGRGLLRGVTFRT